MKRYLFLILSMALILAGFSYDNSKPTIKILTPNKAEKYIISRPTIKASFYDKNGINMKSIKIYLNNQDVTDRAQITKSSISYTPKRKLKRGTQVVKITLSNKLKISSTVEWCFTVGTPIYKLYKNLNLNSFDININGSLISLIGKKNIDLSNLTLDSLYKKLFFIDEISCRIYPKNNSDLNYMKYSFYGDKAINQIDITGDKEIFYLELYNQALNNGWHLSPYSKYNNYILATSSNYDALLDSLKNKMCYTSNNDNINLEFNINNHQMGSIIKNPKKLNFSIGVVDLASKNKIKDISIISNGHIFKKMPGKSNLEKIEFTVKEFEKNSYYYLIVTQENNKITISAPIWIE